MSTYIFLGLGIGFCLGIFAATAGWFFALNNLLGGWGMQESEREFIADESLKDGFDWRR